MKRVSLILIFFFLFVGINIHAQEMSSGSNFLSIGVGPAANYWTPYYSGGTPAFRLTLDHGFKEKGPGIITLGGSVGFFYKYYSSYYEYHNVIYNYKWNWNYFSLAFRAGYCYNLKDANIPDMNVYGGLGLGLIFSTFHDTYNGPTDGYIGYDNSGTDFLFNLYLGADYFITPKTAFYLEFGYDISYVTAGVTFKLK